MNDESIRKYINAVLDAANTLPDNHGVFVLVYNEGEVFAGGNHPCQGCLRERLQDYIERLSPEHISQPEERLKQSNLH